MTETFHAGPGLGRLSDVTVIHGDCLEAMAELAADSVDAIVTDPPYGLSNTDTDHVIEALAHWLAGDRAFVPHVGGGGFMGKDWDKFIPPPAVWDECLRVLKPGGFLLSFAGTRTMGLMETSIRLAGFEIRPSIAWLAGSGFPKSRNVSRDLDDRRCRCEGVESNRATTPQAEHDVPGLRSADVPPTQGTVGGSGSVLHAGVSEPSASADRNQAGTEVRRGQSSVEGRGHVQAPEGELHRATLRPLSVGVSGDGADGRLHHGASTRDGSVDRTPADTAGVREPHKPQPSRQPARKPRAVSDERGSQAWGGWPVCDRCSQPVVPNGLGTDLKPSFEPVVVARKPFKGNVAANVLAHGTGALNIDGCRIAHTQPLYAEGGRWPANVVLDADQAAALDEQSGTRAAGNRPKVRNADKNRTAYGDFAGQPELVGERLDSGGASRFFKVAVEDEMTERFRYCAKAPKKERPVVIDADGKPHSHTTVKPLTLMRWLVRLVTPPGGMILDPFAGSGTTVEAALLEGFRVIGVEKGGPPGTTESHYLAMIQQRIACVV